MIFSSGLKQLWNLDVLNILVAIIVSLNLSSVAAYFKYCDHTFEINPGYSYLESQHYPHSYPARSSCRYKFVAPLDYEITINCTTNLNRDSNACSTEFFYISRDGDIHLRDAEQFCGQGIIVRKSLFRSIVLAYISRGSWGNFRCHLSATPQPCDCGWSINTKISNGQQADINEYPSMVALKAREDLPPFCGGTIVSHYYILTSAHCTQYIKDPADYIVKVGDHDMTSRIESKYAATYLVSDIIEHPSYESIPLHNDISLLRTKTAIEWTRGVGPICLPSLQLVNIAYKDVDIIGWGTTFFGGPFSETLQKIVTIVTDNVACAKRFSTTTTYSSQLCTYDFMGLQKESCTFDSGGPVIIRGKVRQFLVGCISFGDPCSIAYAMGVSTRITSYLPWIHKNIGYAACNKTIQMKTSPSISDIFQIFTAPQ